MGVGFYYILVGDQMIQDFCAGGLVFLQEKLLILQRFNGVWLFPKGHIDPGETPKIAAVREVQEECGLQARILTELGETKYNFTENEVYHEKTVSWYLMRALDNEITLEKEFFLDYQLITVNQIKRLSFSHDQELALKAFNAIKNY